MVRCVGDIVFSKQNKEHVQKSKESREQFMLQELKDVQYIGNTRQDRWPGEQREEGGSSY